MSWVDFRMGLLDSPGVKQMKIEAFINQMIEHLEAAKR